MSLMLLTFLWGREPTESEALRAPCPEATKLPALQTYKHPPMNSR
jgi:hypothetical protein